MSKDGSPDGIQLDWSDSGWPDYFVGSPNPNGSQGVVHVISGRPAADCDEAAGATRIKRLRDTLGNQIVSELLVENIARRGYMLAIDKDVIKVI